MGKIVLFMHASLDGFAANKNRELNWVSINRDIFDYVEERVSKTNTALYGRVTFQMMESYWPTAANKPDATKHDRVHAAWYKQAHKVVLSNTLDQSAFVNTTFIGKEYPAAIRELKKETTGEILLFGSPSTAHALLAENLVDECWLFVNPVLLGEGLPVFKGISEKQSLKLLKTHIFSSGVVCLHHEVQRED